MLLSLHVYVNASLLVLCQIKIILSCIHLLGPLPSLLFQLLDVPVYSKPGLDPDWKQLYRENLSLKLNWQHGNCDVIDCKGHKDRWVIYVFSISRDMFTAVCAIFVVSRYCKIIVNSIV